MPKYRLRPEELALLAAIHAEPREDTPRLVYADWLEEHDQAEYAEFIRWQCQNPVELKIPRPSAKTLTKWRTETPSSVDERMHQRLGLNFGQWGRPCPSDTDLRAYYRGLPITVVKWVISDRVTLDRFLKGANPRLRFELGLNDSTLDLLSHPIFIRADAITFGPADRTIPLTVTSFLPLSTWAGIGSVRTLRFWGVLERDVELVRGLFPAATITPA